MDRTGKPVLVADLGGTQARFALARVNGGAINVGAAKTLIAADYKSVEDAVAAYLDGIGTRPEAACFAVAAPIGRGAIEFTNSRWRLDPKQFAASFGFNQFYLANDFEALAASVRHLRESDFISVRPGRRDQHAPALVLGPGTGLGQALIAPTGTDLDGTGERIIHTEGGHVGFAPVTDEEIEILKFIARQNKKASGARVFAEQLLSGRGIVNIHRALGSIAGANDLLSTPDEITNAAKAGRCRLAVKTIETFCAILGSFTGDAVLATGARGRVVLGGGILPEIRELLMNSRFAERFSNKGAMGSFVEGTPVDLIIRNGAALLGAAAIFRERSGEK